MKDLKKFPLKQTHLDFHTSPDIDGIGVNFSKENFQEAIKLGNLDSITVFAKCHHGVCYYPTEVGTMHPNLDFDLTGAMIDAAHEVGVRAPVYITAGWSHKDAIDHPEWVQKRKDGSMHTTENYEFDKTPDSPKKHCAWHMLCLNDGNGYTDHIYKITEEVCKRYKDIDGLFYDICVVGEVCYCESCLKGMKEMGLNPEDDEDAKRYFIIKRQAFMEKCGEIMRKYHPDATIFFNSGGADPRKKDYHHLQTHFEMEDLPTAWGGYDKFPMRAKFFAKKGKPFMGMTGKFHLDWGEFGGFKAKEALKFEIAIMAMYGASASIGDHMHPDGEMEMQTYENIGFAYDYLEEIAPYCYGGKFLSNLGVYITDDWDTNNGISKILLENQLDYDVVYNNNFADFDTVIISGKAEMDEKGLKALNSYIANGGKVLLMGDSLVKDGKFMIDTGLEYIGKPEFDCDYIVPVEKIENLPNAPMLSSFPGHKTENKDAEIYAEIITPYFSRTYRHFCGHKNTPYNKESKKMPAIAKKGNVVYMAHYMPEQYEEYGSIFNKRYFMFALNLVYSGPVLKIEGMESQGRATIIQQENRYCVNLAYASPIRKGRAEIIEDIVPIYNIKAEIKTDKNIKRVYNPLTNEELEFKQEEGKVSFVVPKLHCHTSVVVEF